jgi:hypothetical protein
MHIYMDESGQTTDRYMCVGGIALRADRAEAIRKEVAEIAATYRLRKEVKWNNLRRDNLAGYKAMVRYFFRLLEEKRVHFHVLVCDFAQIDHRANGGRGVSVGKMFYQFALHRAAKRYGKLCDLHLFPDSGDHAAQLLKHQHHLNNSARKFLPVERARVLTPVKLIAPTQSHLEPLLQLNDIILGAVAYRRNERYDEPTASKHRKALARLVSTHAESLTFNYQPPKWRGRFTVWSFSSGSLRS